jgi:hemerythrin-like domain-containing protein
MKRHPALRDLSSDHHQGLVQARRLTRAAGEHGTGSTGGESEDASAQARPREALRALAADFVAFWHRHTAPHFREEEEVLLPAFARFGDPAAPHVVRTLVEHVHIRRLVGDLRRQLAAGPVSADTVRALGESLREHIRFEENVLFPMIEGAMPEQALLQMAEEARRFRAAHEAHKAHKAHEAHEAHKVGP